MEGVEGVEVVVVMVVDICVAVDRMQYNLLSTCPSKKLHLLVLSLAGELDCWNAPYCSDIK